MNRRGHLSSKIPNVKLRPAAPTRRSTRAQHNPSPERDDSPWGDNDEDDPTAIHSPSSDRPWSKIVVTFTGIAEKAELAALVKELGGSVNNALTVDVTHVVASSYGSEKYNYAVQNNLPVLSPSWIRDAHRRWLAGEELDVEASIAPHRLQPFFDLKIAVTGIDRIDYRKQVIKWINAAGGTYSRDLDRSCTHLVSAYPTKDPKSKASEKIKWALKEIGDREAARRRGRRVEGEDMMIVYEEWIWDCVGLRGRLREDKYDARKPRPQGRVSAEEVIDGSWFERLEAEERAKANPVMAQEEDDEELVSVRKRRREGGMDMLVGELLSTTGQERPNKAVKLEAGDTRSGETTPTAATAAAAATEEAVPRRPGAFERKQSVLHNSRIGAFDQSAGTNSLAGPSRLPAGQTATAAHPEGKKRIFENLRFSHAIAEGYQGLENALVQHGGEMVAEADRLAGAEVDYVVVRLASRTHPAMPPVSDDQPPAIVVTECWVEACCFKQRLLSPDDNLVFRPLNVPTPIPGAERLLVHISGFSTETSVYLRRLLKTIGGVMSEKLNRKATHLVCGAPSGQKYIKAKEWGVTPVQASWLWTMGRTGQLEPESEHFHVDPDAGVDGMDLRRAATNLAGVTELDASVILPGMNLGGEIDVSRISSTTASRSLKGTPTHVNVDHSGDATGRDTHVNLSGRSASGNGPGGTRLNSLAGGDEAIAIMPDTELVPAAEAEADRSTGNGRDYGQSPLPRRNVLDNLAFSPDTGKSLGRTTSAPVSSRPSSQTPPRRGTQLKAATEGAIPVGASALGNVDVDKTQARRAGDQGDAGEVNQGEMDEFGAMEEKGDKTEDTTNVISASATTSEVSATASALLGRDGVTAALRILAEREAAPQSKMRPRPRTSLRPRSIASPLTHSPSKPKSDTNPSSTAEDRERERERERERTNPLPVPQAPAPGVDESMRVTYADPVSEKERKRLLDAVMRGSKGGRGRK